MQRGNSDLLSRRGLSESAGDEASLLLHQGMRNISIDQDMCLELDDYSNPGSSLNHPQGSLRNCRKSHWDTPM